VTQLSDHYTILEERIKYKAIRHDPTDDVPIIHIISFFMWTFYKFSYYYVSPLIEKDMDENYTYNFFIIFRYFSFRLEIIVFFLIFLGMYSNGFGRKKVVHGYPFLLRRLIPTSDLRPNAILVVPIFFLGKYRMTFFEEFVVYYVVFFVLFCYDASDQKRSLM